MADPRFIDGLGTIADRFDGFIIDQWGVLHDGQRAYPGATEVLAELQRRAKPVALLSNSGRRAEHSRRHLASMGIDTGGLAGLVTSGEAAWLVLKHRTLPPFDRVGNRCFLITRDGDRDVVADTAIVLVERLEEADFLFLSGVDSPHLGLADFAGILTEAAERSLPVLCSNPDLAAPSGGDLILAPGGVAAEYERMGGTVVYVGKPFAPIYSACFDLLTGIDHGAILAVGDSLHHDIAGAAGVGLATCFVTQGVHAEEFPTDLPRADFAARLAGALDEGAAPPNFAIDRLVW